MDIRTTPVLLPSTMVSAVRPTVLIGVVCCVANEFKRIGDADIAARFKMMRRIGVVWCHLAM